MPKFNLECTSRFFNTAGNVNIASTAIGDVIVTIEQFSSPLSATMSGTIAGLLSLVGGAYTSIYTVATSPKLSISEKMTIAGGTFYGAAVPAAVAATCWLVEGAPDPLLAFTLVNGVLSGVNKGISTLINNKLQNNRLQEDEKNPLFIPSPRASYG